MTCNQPQNMSSRQQGAVTLILAVIILLLMTIVVIYTAKVGMLELKSSSNTVRAKEAHYIAQGGLDYAVAQYTASNSIASYSENLPLSTSSPAANFSVNGSSTASGFVQFRSTGNGPDGTATAVVEEQFGFIPIGGFGNLPPLMANGDYSPGGTMTIIANPNGAGDGVPLSGWIDSATPTGVSSFSTCEQDEFLFGEGNTTGAAASKTAYPNDINPEFYTCDACSCTTTAGAMCSNASDLEDGLCEDFVIETASTAVPSTFENLFNREEAYWETVFEQAYQLDDCEGADSLESLSPDVGSVFYTEGTDYFNRAPIVWVVDADCSINFEVGTYEHPVILVIDGNLQVQGGGIIWGILYAFDRPDDGASIDVELRGGFKIYGSVLANTDVDMGSGTNLLYYAPRILDKLGNNGSGYYLPARKPGSWKDY